MQQPLDRDLRRRRDRWCGADYEPLLAASRIWFVSLFLGKATCPVERYRGAMTSGVALVACGLTVIVIVVCFVALATVDESSSTAALGLIFIPLYGAATVLVVWIAAFVISIVRQRRFANRNAKSL
jgi:hypothetical protein